MGQSGEDSGLPGGFPVRLALPHFSQTHHLSMNLEEQTSMSFYPSEAADYSYMLQEAAARTGFSATEMQELLESELEIDHLLNYITAVVSDRMN